MTDNEIIKALECLRGNAFDCGECPYCSCYPAPCEQQVAKDALSLINRQKAEIEKLKGSTIVSNIMESQRIKREAKAKAYKEFAEIIKDKWFDNRYDSPDVDFDDFISNLLKEMVGEEE